MNNSSNNTPDKELSLLDLFMVVWTQKIMIISITLIITLLTGLFNILIMKPIYNSDIDIIINMPETYSTKYGDYKMPITGNSEYINLVYNYNILNATIKDMGQDAGNMTTELLKKRITITNGGVLDKQSTYFIHVTAGSPILAQKLAQSLYNNYIEYMDIMFREMIVDKFYNEIKNYISITNEELNLKKGILLKNEELLAQTPQTINQKEAMKEIENNVNDFIILENVINPNYTGIENSIIMNKQDINSLEIALSTHTEYLKELENEKEAFIQFYETQDISGLKLNEISVIDSNIFLVSIPTLPSQKSGPDYTRNITIGFIFGGLMGITIAFIRKYIFKYENK